MGLHTMHPEPDNLATAERLPSTQLAAQHYFQAVSCSCHKHAWLLQDLQAWHHA
jgi:hypothetical protein